MLSLGHILCLWLFASKLLKVSRGCTTFLVGQDATRDGSVFLGHTNDGDGGVAGNLEIVFRQEHDLPSRRPVSGGHIPQVRETYKYLTKVGGYAALNEYQVGLAESTCVSKLAGNSSGILNIVDLSELAMERSKTARDAIITMGNLAETYGYNDNGESLFVSDPVESFVFHITPDDTKKSAVWVAEVIPSNHAAVVANSFIIHDVNLEDKDGEKFLFSSNIVDVAVRQGFWNQKLPFNFNKIYSGPEPGYRYTSGRRMWYAFKLLGIDNLPPVYDNLQVQQPYNTSYVIPSIAGKGKIDLTVAKNILRSYYQNTKYDMATKLSGGPFGSPDRWAAGAGEHEVEGHWERNIAISRSIISYILQLRHFLPNELATMWIAPHAAHTSFYVPFVVGQSKLPRGYQAAAVNEVGRGISAWQASRFVFNIAQLKFSYMIKDIIASQNLYENRSEHLQRQIERLYTTKNITLNEVTELYVKNAEMCVSAWWKLSDDLMLRYADGYCNGYGPCMSAEYGTHIGYSSSWLEQMSDYRNGPDAIGTSTS